MINFVYAFGLIETFYQKENECYQMCSQTYQLNTYPSAQHLDACKKGCDHKLFSPNADTTVCSGLCDSYRMYDLQAACIIGCNADVVPPKEGPVIPQEPPVEVAPESPSESGEQERPKSIILIRLRERPLMSIPSFDRVFNSDPFQMFNDMLKQIKEKANEFDKTLGEQPDFGPVFHLSQSIPILPVQQSEQKSVEKSSDSSSSSESSSEEEKPGRKHRPFIAEMKHIIQHPQEHEKLIKQRIQPLNARLQQFFNDVKTEWNDLIKKQPKIPIWIFICVLLTSSAILWYMAMSMCRASPHRNHLSIRSQELIFHPYDSNDLLSSEKEKNST